MRPLTKKQKIHILRSNNVEFNWINRRLLNTRLSGTPINVNKLNVHLDKAVQVKYCFFFTLRDNNKLNCFFSFKLFTPAYNIM